MVLKEFFEDKKIFIISFLILGSHFIFLNYSANYENFLPGAREFINPDWIKNDWFLGLPSGERYTRFFFDIIMGPFFYLLSFQAVDALFRIIILALISYFIQSFAKLFNVSLFLIIPGLFMFATQRLQSIVAGEWVVGGIDPKCFAYFFSFMALLFLIRKKYQWMFLFQGIAVSFHILVGFYSTFCLLFTFVVNFKEYQSDWRKLLIKSWLFFLGSSIGIFSIIKQLQAFAGED